MELENLFIGDIYQLIYQNELEQSYDVRKVKETILYRKGRIDTTYMDLNSSTLKKYTGDYNTLKPGECFVNEFTLRPFAEILSEQEKKEEQIVRKVRTRYKEYKKQQN